MSSRIDYILKNLVLSGEIFIHEATFSKAMPLFAVFEGKVVTFTSLKHRQVYSFGKLIIILHELDIGYVLCHARFKG